MYVQYINLIIKIIIHLDSPGLDNLMLGPNIGKISILIKKIYIFIIFKYILYTVIFHLVYF